MSNPLFDSFYQNLYQERWSRLREALRSQDIKWGFIPSEPLKPLDQLSQHQPGQIPGRSENGLLQEYFMDPASLIIAQQLPLKGVERVLDMCAAPGGKALVLFSRLSLESPQAEMIANEISASRRGALKKVIQNYISQERRKKIWLKGQDGVRYGLTQPESFDSILLDAPCSGEAHLLQNEIEMEKWSPQRTKRLAIQQYSLLSSAWSALKPGGHILYSTCSVSPYEKDDMIPKLINKKKGAVSIIDLHPEISPEKTQYGIQYFPDQSGFGPLYGCLIQKSRPKA